MSNSDAIALIGLILGALSGLGGVILWYKSAVEKRYAAQRDFNHIRRNQEQLIANMAENQKDLDEILEAMRADLKEVKSYAFVLSQRFDNILARLDSQSGLFGSRIRRDDRE